jgi:hypothetical protein
LRQVGEDTGEAVGGATLEEQMMRAFMDHDEKGVIGKGAKQVGCAEHDPPGLVLYQPGKYDLEQYQPEYGKKGVFILADQLSDLRMLL